MDNNNNKKENYFSALSGFRRAVPIILAAIAAFVTVCFFSDGTGALGAGIASVLLGLFSVGAYSIPVLLIIHAIFYAEDFARRRTVSRVVFSIITVFFIATIEYAIVFWSGEYVFAPARFYTEQTAGGFLGSILAFALVKLLGSIGVIILASALFAIYIIFFFSGKNSSLSRFLLVVLSAIVGLLAKIEGLFKKMFGAARRAKQEKIKKQSEKINAELLDDQFFTSDGAMREIKVAELGIHEEREPSEENLTLQDSVFHKSAAPATSDSSPVSSSAKPLSARKNANLNFDIHECDDASASNATAASEKPEINAAEASKKEFYGIDEPADSVFTKDFNPFDFIAAEKIANKASSKARKSSDGVLIEDVAEPVRALPTQEQIDKARRQAEFEMRKQQLKEMHRAEALQAAQDSAVAIQTAAEQQHSATAITEQNAAQIQEIPPVASISTAPQNEEPLKAAVKTVEFNLASEEKTEKRNAPIETSSFTRTLEKVEAPIDDDQAAAEEISKIVASGNPMYARSENLTTRTEIRYTEAAGEKKSEESPFTATFVTGEQSDSQDYEPVSVRDTFATTPSAATAPEHSSAASTNSSEAIYAPSSSAAREGFTVTEATIEAPNVAVSCEPTVREYESSAVTAESEGEFKEFASSIPGINPAVNTASTAELAEETIKIERTILSPTPTPIEAAIEARDSRYTVIGADMPLSEDKEEEQEEAVSEGFNWSTEEAPDVTAATAIPENENATIFSFGDEDEEDEDGDSGISYEDIPEEDAITTEEIPPEEQNPEVIRQREMFPFLDRQDITSSPKSENVQDESTITAENAIAANEDSHAEEPEAFEASAEAENPMVEIAEEEARESANNLPKAEDDLPPFDIDEAKPANSAMGLVALNESKKKEQEQEKKKADYSKYVFPPIDFLGKDEAVTGEDVSIEIQENADKLIETLASFNVTASIKGVDRGPRITRYEVVPAKGVKVSNVMNLQDNIALELAANEIRMEAPIPGKSAIGIEIPNKRSSTVRLRDLLETEDFVSFKSKTSVCIGRDVAGQPVFGDIATMPHLLIAGATGMGKSVCINALMISMLYKARPDEVKFIMIDPKQVEFTMYNGIPHLLVPVVSDAKQAAGVLMWAVEEMERRYGLLNPLCVRNVDAYNDKVTKDPSLGEPLSRIVIVIDEFADLMLQVRDPVENLVMRIAQKARAAGIHLIIGTQRPTANVITGTIKANIPSRISCKVASNVDSRTVLDASGAEKLLNKGDMLYAFAGAIKPLRVQGAFVSDGEVEAVMEHLKSFSDGDNYDNQVMEEIERAAQKCSKKGGGSDYDDGDDGSAGEGYLNDRQFLEAVEVAVNTGKISTSLIQRKLSIGYGKAAKFIDIMEDMGIVGEQNGQRPRDVKITPDEWREKLARATLD